jgi:hypothetical protein
MRKSRGCQMLNLIVIIAIISRLLAKGKGRQMTIERRSGQISKERGNIAR